MKGLPQTYIKNVVIEMIGPFEFDNFPHTSKNKKRQKPFVGRKAHRDKFVKMLKDHGVFLVTGYRGMGKTSFVNMVLDDYNHANKRIQKLQEVRITMAQKQPTETEILKLMVTTLREKCREKLNIRRKEYLLEALSMIFKSLGSLCLVIFFILALKIVEVPANSSDQIIGFVGLQFHTSEIKPFFIEILTAVFLLAIVFLFVLTIAKLIGYSGAYVDLDKLYKRCYATTSYENDHKGEVTIDSIGTKVAYVGGKRTEVYPIASSKEIEFELSNIITKFKDSNGYRFVFIFDELDKIDHHQVGPIELYVQQANLNQTRERKEVIQEIISGLKNFLTTADASFIFIAGREMFEASLADIADRQSAISSVFTYVFYIESLLKESIKETSSLSSAIEEYLFILIHKREPKGESLYTVLDESKFKTASGLTGVRLEEERKAYWEAATKVNLFLQHFVVYLTYRSNGSPKKLIRMIHEFIRVDISDSELTHMIVWRKIGNSKKILPYALYFDQKQQQRIGFISYLYRPFLVKYGNSFKQLSDNLVVSTSFLFDHLLKFHPFAFSHTHIELIPEILAANRTPALRDHIKKIIDYLTLNHIRETEVGLFDYKFYSKTVNEIFYLSKSFEEESAAFNFTLDESYITKLHVKGKLKELRTRYQDAGYPDTGQSSALSIAYMNGTLGDLHFFDQEYDDAIVAYSDALQSINVHSNMNMHEFILALKFKLKLGLTFEKTKSYEECLSLYSDSIIQAKQFIYRRLESSKKEYKFSLSAINIFGGKNRLGLPIEDNDLVTSALNDVLQICNQAFLATLVLEEKMGVEGITAKKSSLTMGGFLTLAENIGRRCGLNNTIVSNLFMHVGNLLYFKNSVRAFEWSLGANEDKMSKEKMYKAMGAGWPEHFFKDINILKEQNRKFQPALEESFRYPIAALNMYCMGIKYLLKGRINAFNIDFMEDEPITSLLKILSPSKFRRHFTSLSKIHFKYLAIYLSNIGDCLLSMVSPGLGNDKTSYLYSHGNYYTVSEMIDPACISELFNKLDDRAYAEPNWLNHLIESISGSKKYRSIQAIICYYYLSGYYFGKCSRERSRSFQLRKILYTIRLVSAELPNDDPEYVLRFITVLQKTIVSEILAISSSAAEYSNVQDVMKFRGYLKDKVPDFDVDRKILNNISTSPDAREAVILFSHIKLRLLGGPLDKLDKIFASDYSLSTQYLRLLELTYAAKYYELSIKSDAKAISISLDAVGYLHSLTSVIDVMEIYDNDYLVGNSFVAYHHLRLAQFFMFDKNGKNKLGLGKDQCKMAREEMGTIVKNRSSKRLFQPIYNLKMAAMYYDRTVKLHTAGDDYKKAINDSLYLEDDLSDSAYHFGAAMDRHLLVSGKLHRLLLYIKGILQQCQKGYDTYSGI